jgi:hypothetical protein
MSTKPIVTVKSCTHDLVYKVKGSHGIGAWVDKKEVEQHGLAIAFDLKLERLERNECWSARQTTLETMQALGI